MEIKVLYKQKVCWQYLPDLKGYPPDYLSLIVFDRGYGPEVLRTCFKDGFWQRELLEGRARTARVPRKFHNNFEMLCYQEHWLKPLIG